MLCFAIRDKEKRFALTIEKYQLPNEPFFGKLEYRNINKVFVKILQVDKKDFEEAKKLRQELSAKGQYKDFQAVLIDIFNSKKPFLTFEKNLPTEGDFQSYSVEIDFPKLKLGEYVVLISDSENFSYESHAVLIEFIQTTNLSFIQRYSSNANEFYVVHRKTGEPLKGIQVEAITQVYKDYETGYQEKKIYELVTDKNGYFSIPLSADTSRNYYIVLKNSEESLEISNFDPYESYYKYPYKSIYYQRVHYSE
ncbi:MAG: DUF4198 domain-containing protein, partial [Leptospiraceae bacterium]|nr:DUF4198 domain-containing protein [Leptospiraceae bacterium]